MKNIMQRIADEWDHKHDFDPRGKEGKELLLGLLADLTAEIEATETGDFYRLWQDISGLEKVIEDG